MRNMRSRDDGSTECEYANWEKPRNTRNVDKQDPQCSGGDTAWSRCSRLMAVCAALLCVLLLSIAILQSIKLNNMTEERDRLQFSYDSMTSRRDQLHAERDKLQKMLNDIIQQRLRYFTTKRMGWNEARRECRSRGADLVIINNQKEQEYLSQMCIGEAWIGLSDSAEEGKWTWVDGTKITTGFWWQGEPNNYDGIEDCAATGSKFAKAEVMTWADYPCETELNAICEKKAND
ncbi:hypothetical protein KOW79_010833 [Hemibagrus wyckioides]|uniref:C-type lectin domain-containing protein n=1 Tax=Hemibagrus wyckioides TaxID=337641 RepID=A0A9D3SNK2_9TELE|nr:CD209 antigen-like protein C [Hemibagrus wyckioides]KAG7325908.1 hypothetical protein KOW79_010833 [Hemibagrus wyckioides]